MIRPLAWTAPARASVAASIGLDEAADALLLSGSKEGSPRYPKTWAIPSTQYAVAIHRPLVGENGLVFQVADRKIQAVDLRSGEEKFSIPVDSASSPALLGDRLVCQERGALFVYDPATRREVWRQPMGGSWGRQPLVTPDGKVIAGKSASLVAFDGATGQELWCTDTGSEVNPLAHTQGVILATCGIYAGETTRLLAFDSAGTQIWSKSYDRQVSVADGPVYYLKEKMFKLFGTSHSLKAVDPKTGRKLWSESADASTDLFAVPGGVVVRDGSQLRMREAQTGRQLWSYQLNGECGWNGPFSNVQATEKGLIVTHPDGQITGLDPATGKELWNEPSRGPSYHGPAVGPDGVLVLKTEGTLKGLIPRELVAIAGQPRPGISEGESSVQVGNVQLKKRR